MKIILTQEVSGLGTPGDVVEVKDGYGRNYLLPQGFAIRWTKGAEKQVTVIKRARAAREIRDLGQANEVKASSRASRSRCRRAPAPAAGCSARSPRPRSSTRSRPPAVRRSTGVGSSCRVTSRPRVPTTSRSSCTPR